MLPEPHLRNQFHSTSMVAVPRTMPSQALWSLRTACRAVSAPMLWPPTYAGVPALLPRRTCLEKASRSSTYKITLILACRVLSLLLELFPCSSHLLCNDTAISIL